MNPRRPRPGFSVLELLVVLACLGLVMGAAWQLFGEGVATTQRITGTLDAQHELRVRFQELVHELQGARRIFFPTPGGKSQAGIGYVDREGRPIMIFAREEAGSTVLYRADLQEKSRVELSRGIGAFRVTVPLPERGEPPRTVNLALGIDIREASQASETSSAPQSLRMVTSVTLRAPDIVLPE